MASSTNGVFMSYETIQIMILIISIIGFCLGSAVTGLFMIKDMNKRKERLKSNKKELKHYEL